MKYSRLAEVETFRHGGALTCDEVSSGQGLEGTAFMLQS